MRALILGLCAILLIVACQAWSQKTWIRTIGYPLYDMYTDAASGVNTMKTSWGSVDGLHPGQSYTQGSDIIGQRLASLVQLVGD
jgi:hypothetical protein